MIRTSHASLVVRQRYSTYVCTTINCSADTTLMTEYKRTYCAYRISICLYTYVHMYALQSFHTSRLSGVRTGCTRVCTGCLGCVQVVWGVYRLSGVCTGCLGCVQVVWGVYRLSGVCTGCLGCAQVVLGCVPVVLGWCTGCLECGSVHTYVRMRKYIGGTLLFQEGASPSPHLVF